MSCNYFLTGCPGAGKSTIIRKLTAGIGGVGGFKTVMRRGDAQGRFRVYIMPYGADDEGLSELEPVAVRDREANSFRAFPEVFDREGAAILRAAADCDLIVMDEIGFMEAEAFVFQKAVLDALDGAVPVLGVIKPANGRADTRFMREVRARRDVRVFEVTPESRESAAAALEGEIAGLTGRGRV